VDITVIYFNAGWFSFQSDIVITNKGIWFFGLSMAVMLLAVLWRIYGMVQQLIT
jgi:hypothetical protein